MNIKIKMQFEERVLKSFLYTYRIIFVIKARVMLFSLVE